MSGNFPIYRWTGSTWTPIPGAASQLAVASDGTLWARQSNNTIWTWDGASWTQRPGLARELAAGGGGVYAIGINALPGGYAIYKWTGSTWIPIVGAAEHLSNDPAGVLWALQ